ncbi:MAG: FtsQ-type POTRA domain-containing protein [Acidobacteria bacterium]|nr:FtsQ-type POTRA domain-containing protein [Acidobacteriota bacterium]
MSRRPLVSTRARARGRKTKEPRRPEVRRAPRPARESAVVATIAPARRRRWGLAIKIAAGAAGAVTLGTLLVVGGRWLLHQSFLRVQHVSLSGETHESPQQVLSATHLNTHPAMIDLSESALQRDLSVYPWVGSVSLVKHWPNSVDLAIHEVRAVAVAYDARHVLRYVSATGRDLTPAPLTTNLPTLATSPASLAATSWPYGGPESAGAVVASQLPEAFSAQVNQIIVDAQGNVTLQLTTPLRFFLGPATNLRAKFVAIASAIAHGTFAAGDVVDVTTPNELSVTGPSAS